MIASLDTPDGGIARIAKRKHPMNTTGPQGVDGRIVVA